MNLWSFAIQVVKIWMYVVAFLFFVAIWHGSDQNTGKPWSVGHYIVAILCMAVSLMVGLLLK